MFRSGGAAARVARKAVDVEDFRQRASKRLPRPVFDALEGGAEGETTLRANAEAYRSVTLRPRSLQDVSHRSLKTEILGTELTMPLMLGPTGAARLADSRAELVMAEAAAEAGIVYVHGGLASYSLEDVANAGSGATLWYQMYLPAERSEARRLIERVAHAGYGALVLTIDTPVRGQHLRDERNGFSLPHRLTPKLILQCARRPTWSLAFVRGSMRASARRGASEKRGYERLALSEVEAALAPARWPVTWDDLGWVRDVWSGPLLIKGFIRPEECERVVGLGIDGIVLSNHGGRQLDGEAATIEALFGVVDAVSRRTVVLVDGGIRRGSDVIKALAVGADACLIGRPYLYGLAAAGESGLARVLEIYRTEIDRTMALVGATSVHDLDRSFVGV